ncbi:MAG: ECF RNA polymerase sigma-E factor [Verrucomicrobia subdivision 3 bacterium]|nr:ECF RNA polymerase sigma-E factor [Limisphaerales bacterium]MCS1414635.1 ECF RNA polymerase sigma-E factor [Limisphaerales bacterium]
MADESDGDAALMLKVQEGDFASFEALVNRYKQPVVNVVARIIRDPTEAEDLAQNVFLQVYKAADRYKVTAKFSTWLFTIARNLSLNELRRRSRHPATSLDASPEWVDDESSGRQFKDEAISSASDDLLQAELMEKIDEVLGELPVNQRTAIVLLKEKGLSYEDIAGILGCSVSAVKSLIHRGRETIKSRLKPYLVSGVWEASSKGGDGSGICCSGRNFKVRTVINP